MEELETRIERTDCLSRIEWRIIESDTARYLLSVAEIYAAPAIVAAYDYSCMLLNYF